MAEEIPVPESYKNMIEFKGINDRPVMIHPRAVSAIMPHEKSSDLTIIIEGEDVRNVVQGKSKRVIRQLFPAAFK